MSRETDLRVRPRRYRIVVGLDLTEYCEIVLEHALDQAARHDAPDLHFLYVKERAHRKRSAEELQQRLSSIVYPALQTFNRHSTDWHARLHVRAGKPDVQIATLAQDMIADLIVIGQFGLHYPRDTVRLPGRILRGAPCPTLVVSMPPPMQRSPICKACAAVREDSDGENWFCDDHHAPDRVGHATTAVTVWTGGSAMW
jgi:nucleotide-binding universal stress UspA family protein